MRRYRIVWGDGGYKIQVKGFIFWRELPVEAGVTRCLPSVDEALKALKPLLLEHDSWRVTLILEDGTSEWLKQYYWDRGKRILYPAERPSLPPGPPPRKDCPRYGSRGGCR